MSITPRGMSIQEAYRNYVDDKFLVNRKYQRKLVWTVDEKEYLIDSILKGLPIPLILLGEVESGRYEIIDGLQRMNAIISFIENRFKLNNKFFDVAQFSRAKQIGDSGNFEYEKNPKHLLTPAECANILDYQLAVTIYPTTTEAEITDIFGRINSGGKQLSPQEKRQAGMTDTFSDIVKKISSEIRGDSSQDLVSLSKMPEISIDSTRENIGYGLKAEEIFWCKHGILWKAQLRDSEDEEMVADIIASIIHNEPIARSRKLFDKMYETGDAENIELNTKLIAYGVDRIMHEIKVTFSIIQKIFEEANISMRDAVNPKSANPVKGSFFAIFMAVFKLVVNEEKSPDQPKDIVKAVNKLQSQMISTANSSTTSDRLQNINKTIGLIQPYFVKKDPPVLRHGSGLAMDLENSIRRSKVETNRYECKQGFVDLSEKRAINEKLYDVIIDTICGIANIGPDADGYVFIGITDKESDAKKIEDIDKITPVGINGRFVVGIERELSYMSCNMETYLRKLAEKISFSELTNPLKSQVLSQIDVVEYKGFTVIRIRVPKQTSLSYVGEKSYIREGSETLEIVGPKLVAINKLFN